ncbi:hypothetical protein LCGC14_2472360, partial [marine sediment metagenome]
MNKTKTTLVILLLVFSTVTATYAVFNGYWSKTLSHTITIEGTVSVASNFGYSELLDSPSFQTLVSRTVDTLLPFGGDYYARLVAADSNLQAAYLTINVTGPAGAVVTVDVK